MTAPAATIAAAWDMKFRRFMGVSRTGGRAILGRPGLDVEPASVPGIAGRRGTGGLHIGPRTPGITLPARATPSKGAAARQASSPSPTMPKKKSLAALVTGASRGIGRQIALHLATRGVRVGIHYLRNRAAARAVLDALPGKGHALFRADMGDPDQVARLWRAATRRMGPVGIVVNNAAIHGSHPPLSTDPVDWRKAWDRILAVNLQGPADLSYLAARAMAKSGGGRIVNISSRGAFRGEPESPAYGASKAGINALSQSLAKALAPHGVLVFCIAPGWVETEMAAAHLAGPLGEEIRGQHPLGRVTHAGEVALAAVFCALDAPAAMTGSVIDVNGASYLRT